MSELREEIIETQKARTEFFKWKLIGVSAVGAAGLGMSDHVAPAHGFILALIPLICFYVDLMCWHCSLRVLVIGRFLSFYPSNEQTAYEQFVERARHMGPKHLMNVYALEDWALEWSTRFLSVLIVVAGLTQLYAAPGAARPAKPTAWSLDQAQDWVIIASGLIGIVLSILGKRRYGRRVEELLRTT